MNPWHPTAIRTPLPGCGRYVAGPWRVVLHSTEGDTCAGAIAAYAANGVSPHFTVGAGDSGAVELHQHVALDEASTALRHPPGTIDTNRLSAVQVEVVAYAAHPDWPGPLVAAVRDLLAWIIGEVPIAASGPPFPPYPASYGQTAWRMTPLAWAAFGGVCGHSHVPNNAHGDPGAIDLAALLPTTATTQEVPDVMIADAMCAPGGGVWVLGTDGGVFAYRGAPFHGSYPGLPPAGREGVRSFGSIGARDDGSDGYMLTASDGSKYRFP